MKSKVVLFLVILYSFNSCLKNENTKNINFESTPKKLIDEAKYVLFDTYKIGDVRRYGVFPNERIGMNPKSNKNALETVIDLAEGGVEIIFPEGYYKTNLVLEGREQLRLQFDNASFAGEIRINENLKKESSNIIFLGKVTSYSRFFVRKSRMIRIDEMIVKTDTILSWDKKESRGCNIYQGVEDIFFNKVIIDGLGSGESYYQYTSAAMQIYGWNDNPKNVRIDSLIVNSSDRNGAYITGSDHKFNYIHIKDYATGTTKFMKPIEDTSAGEELIMCGLWINRCNGCDFKEIIINNKDNDNLALKLDEGNIKSSTVIDNINIHYNNIDSLPIFDHELTNIIVKSLN
ncbi:hypothetical protein AWE51_22320 [Aquimarina aggregata]|uniref:Pectate lyase superfamily protein domain-containing protein n=1 Tax=Aquimarina aggregata TaxID=1642818 RepID=A0A163BIM6_9FLAO|nr:hypothetical protein [Aquimarina aggregata]KZS41441.1 hypothetical protein AWE51_22320 [Aquimarina aggregata]